MTYLRERQVVIESLGESITIRELSARAQVKIIEAQEQQGYAGMFIACRYGVPAWSEKSEDEIAEMITLAQAGEIAAAVFGLSGVEDAGKN